MRQHRARDQEKCCFSAALPSWERSPRNCPREVPTTHQSIRVATLRRLTGVLPKISIFSVKNADLTITELASSVPKAVRETEQMGVRGITRNGKAVAFLVSRRVMESILETIELQKNSQLMRLVKADKAGRIAFFKVPDER